MCSQSRAIISLCFVLCACALFASAKKAHNVSVKRIHELMFTEAPNVRFIYFLLSVAATTYDESL